MARFRVNVKIKQPIDMVVQAYIKPENIPFWMNNIEKFEVIKGEAGEADSVAHVHYNEHGKKYIMEDKLEYCEQGKKYVSTISSEALFVRTETTFFSLKASTKMNLVWSGKGKYFILKILLPFIRKRISKLAKNELVKFKYLVEHYGADFTKMLKKEEEKVTL